MRRPWFLLGRGLHACPNRHFHGRVSKRGE
jgi:hypothetical protein